MIVRVSQTGPVDAMFEAPPSKSYTHRALIAGALAAGKTRIEGPLRAVDTELTARGLDTLGVSLEWLPGKIAVTGCGGAFPAAREVTIDCGNSGTTLRLLASAALLSQHPVVLTGSPRMLERPVGPLAGALRTLGGEVTFTGEPGYPPIRISGRLRGGKAEIDGSVSSQFISSILMAAPYADNDVELALPATPASRSYLDVTADVMLRFGARLDRRGYDWFRVESGVPYQGRAYRIEGDYSSASYLFAVAAVCGGRATVTGLNPASVQGDRRFLDALEAMGCRVTAGRDVVTVERADDLAGIEIDMSSSPDTVQTLAAVAAVAASPTTITGTAHLQYKESDRVGVTADTLRRMGAGVEVGENSLTITPAPLHGVAVDPHDDHRTAMAFAVLGLAVGGMAIRDPECVEKSFPGFWEALYKEGLL
ncbi:MULTISPECIES: 3-phosphoshikimate 1-carboxyvinyltransferase [unclassified Methanoculleus]|uniref:3-phosphoshikimate 1-carboxyvinyltransferase n=1 Tax=unclassified Methanoculleus TaxID=2619537 RepID=UPI0025E5E5A1|nr:MULTISPECIES: 3-phosphoshikimate 1-carboxyvinyltransferase [unclassified Methanoculleus]MCK9317107.1 3-phosphoshikimate 1-carboxyvinyltransferase [Methanoculleus sp.]MDD2253403.1 3-phosphoshikimate 1-carboxyvinyltransferase [Methanoculleus sp.]MDD2788832.1 3-phosphoshikimate 1-carboxyvinyltransferase [Methanoculleus sp.]MDD3215018.1 3-phosphoshikimate 1-carboxyvinyltransferase [Methanoculleus sp.]MDD4313992.1 3-phosphoshikimate 1-carboxyvinyltransferase [Methanoculleus sp.]